MGIRKMSYSIIQDQMLSGTTLSGFQLIIFHIDFLVSSHRKTLAITLVEGALMRQSVWMTGALHCLENAQLSRMK